MVRTPTSVPATPRREAAANSEPKYKGVRKRKWGKYVSEIRLPNCRDRIWLGSYDTAEKAARAFDAALFCIRGPAARFNFPNDPPHIAGGLSLAPAEIQAVAQSYANGFDTGSSSQPAPMPQQDNASPSSISDCTGAIGSGTFDWSFWDEVDANRGYNLAVFDEPGEMYLGPNFTQRDDYENEDNGDGDDHGNGGTINVPSFLWNF